MAVIVLPNGRVESVPDGAEQVRCLAYELWQARAPVGSPEVDWFAAEQQLKDADQTEAAAA